MTLARKRVEFSFSQPSSHLVSAFRTTASRWAWIKPMALKCTKSVYILHCLLAVSEKKKAVSLKNVLDKVEKQLLILWKPKRWVCVWQELCVKPSLCGVVPLLTQSKVLVLLSCELNRLVFIFSWNSIFFFLYRMRDKPLLYRVGHLVDIFLKMNKASLSL